MNTLFRNGNNEFRRKYLSFLFDVFYILGIINVSKKLIILWRYSDNDKI